jgi:hypothetical protein
MLTAHSYNDDDSAARPAPAQEPDHYAAQQPAAEVKNDYAEDSGKHQDYNGGDNGQTKYEEEEEDDDDEIDFNLGNGPSTAVTHHDHQDHQDQYEQHDEKPSYSAPPALSAPTKGPNAKEDG